MKNCIALSDQTTCRFLPGAYASALAAPSTGCASPSDVGNQVFVPHTADHFVYQDAN